MTLKEQKGITLDKKKALDDTFELKTRLKEQEKTIKEQQITIAKLEKELRAVLDSKAWRLADFFRRLIRVHLLNCFPSFQHYYLPKMKRWWRRTIISPLARAGLVPDDYAKWMELESTYLEHQKKELYDILSGFQSKPLISIIMPVYNVKHKWLIAAINSVQNQMYSNWQLCIADDCSTDSALKKLLSNLAEEDQRISLTLLPENRGIAGASNAALDLATGEYVALLDNDDELAPHALLEVVRAINSSQNPECIYSDEDKLTEKGHRYDPFFKPDWSPDTLRSYNYICHFTVIKRALVVKLGGFRPGFEGSQDFDLFLRVTEKAEDITHIPQILYHWRAIEGSVGKRGDAKMYAYESAKKALKQHLQRNNLTATVDDGLFLGSYRIRYQITEQPEIAIIIPSKDKVNVLMRCIDSIERLSSYLNFKIVIVDNNSNEDATFDYYNKLSTNSHVDVIYYNEPFNFSKINNFAVGSLNNQYLLFLNNDTEVISEDWLEEMLGYLQREDVGAVGSLLYYPNNTVQHGGIIGGIGGIAGHSHKYSPYKEYGYFGRLKTVQNFSAVTAACLMTKRTIFEEVGGFEPTLSHAFNDVDLCLKIRQKGYLIVYTPYAELYHHESVSRGYEDSPEKMLRFAAEREFCEKRWNDFLQKGDPYYNPHLSLTREDFSLGFSGFSEN